MDLTTLKNKSPQLFEKYVSLRINTWFLNEGKAFAVNQIDRQIEELCESTSLSQSEEVVRLISENQKIINALQKTESDYFNQNNQILVENWIFFQRALQQASSLEEFQEKARLVNAKLYVIKYFTSFKFSLPEDTEQLLKFKVKDYFKDLVTNNAEEFTQRLFELPFDFVALTIRYVVEVLCKDKKEMLSPVKANVLSYLEMLQEKRNNFIKLVNEISQGNANVLSISDAQGLLDVRAFYQDDLVNLGVLEYLMRLLNNKVAQQKLYEEFGKDFVTRMKEQILTYPSYVKYVKDIKKGILKSFFTLDGFQNTEADRSFDDYVIEYFNPVEPTADLSDLDQAPELPVQPEEQSTKGQSEEKPEGEEDEGAEEQPTSEGPEADEEPVEGEEEQPWEKSLEKEKPEEAEKEK